MNIDRRLPLFKYIMTNIDRGIDTDESGLTRRATRGRGYNDNRPRLDYHCFGK